MFKKKKNIREVVPELESLPVGEDILRNSEEETESGEEQQETAEDQPEDSPEPEEPCGEGEESNDFLVAVEAYRAGAGLSEQEMEAILEKRNEIAASVAEGRFDAACFDFLFQGISYSKDIERARNEGIIEGRNQRIAEAFRDLRVEKEREIPALGGTPGIGTTEKSETIFDVAKRAR